MALRKRGGIWYFRKTINGQLFRESTGFADKKSAERRASEIESDIRAGVHGWKSTIRSCGEWWAVFRETYTPLKSAKNRDAQIVAHFLPHFGARPLDEITKSDIVRYLNLRRTQMTGNPGQKNRRLVSESTVRRERGLLQSIFERAIDEGYDIRSPFRGIKRGKDKPRTRVLTLDEETKLLDALHPRFQRFVRFALGTGCRLDEIRGIDSKQDIDWIRGTVHVIGKFRKERDVPNAAGCPGGSGGATRGRRQAMEAEPAAAARGAGGRLGAGKNSIADASRAAPHIRHAVAPGGRRHLQALEDPRAFECCCHRAALRALAERGSRGSKPAGEDS